MTELQILHNKAAQIILEKILLLETSALPRVNVDQFLKNQVHAGHLIC